ncbi:DMT family transporter [Nitrososphaera sp.]|uniref:DMT family transporter n=1 Tax=Nitrososphaera sp. TaxID=1971748 RepID=UPI002EDA6228
MTKQSPAPKQAGRHWFGYLSVLAASALFGSVFTVAKVPLETVDPLALAAVIYVISGISLIPFARASFRLKSRRELRYMVAVTGFGALAAPMLLLYGLQATSASDASILTNGEVLFTIILSSLFFGERPKGRLGMAAVGIVIIGLFIATTNMELSDTILQFNAGNILILASMLMWAIDNNISRRLLTFSDISPAKIAMLKSLFGGLVMLGVTVAAGRWGAIADLELNMWLIVAGLAVSGFGAALLFFLQGIKHIGTIKTMSVFSTTPIFGIAIAALVLGETITLFQGVATGMIIAGILLLSRR